MDTDNLKYKQFLIDCVLKYDDSLSIPELKLLRAEIKVKLAQLAARVNEMCENADAKEYANIMLTALSLKAILHQANEMLRKSEKAYL